MSDSIDRVFSKAVTTIKTLSTRSGYGSLPRPPLETRINLYGLYKQLTEGDIAVDISGLEINSSEDDIVVRKYRAWRANLGVSTTDAKKQYIEVLINTMKIYASGTVESRELLNELEFLYEQIKDLRDDSIAGDSLKSPELLYNPQFLISDLYKSRYLSGHSSNDNLMDLRSIYDKNDSIYSIHSHQHTNNNTNEIPTSKWRTEMTSVINKMIKDLNFLKNLERNRQIELKESNKCNATKLFKFFIKIIGYNIANLVLLYLILKLNKKRQFITRLIGL